MDRKYSVLMSVYYKEKPEWLQISLQSMLDQTLQPDEIVLVKDGPLTEDLDQVIDHFCLSNPGVFRIVPLSKNVGLGPALNAGLSHCKNNDVIRMDSDDYSVPDRCKRLKEVANKHKEYGIVGSYEVEFENDIKKPVSIHKVPEKFPEIFRFMRRRCAILHPTVLYRKDVIQRCGGYNDALLYEDYDLFIRVVNGHHIPVYNIPENLYYIRINPDFYNRRGGYSYMKRLVKFKWQQYTKGYIRFIDFVISGGAHMVVCLMPNFLRTYIYMNFLRKR